MSTLAVTFQPGTESGAGLRALAAAITQLAAHGADRTATGAATVLTIDNAPAQGQVSAQITSGPTGASEVITVNV